ncbi:DUF1360 domain-containing protein [Aquibacillus albus]|uniref:DUF1360 domain-containing protein n=1 Tax=Aquibacillus albus TaxID=1168171 RepID=A0ABS2MZ84_9BACI|nr:DUF1360 domain-containing protein [Aquibacillus albus]MBM7571187.1 hypothetical protein [Aquibacillus albus]
MLSWFSFILLGIATFRLTHLLVFDEITSFIRAPFHEIKEEVLDDGRVEEVISIKGEGLRRFIGELLSCHWCTGVWCACFLYFGFMYIPSIFIPLIVILAVAGVASFIEVVLLRIID